MKLLNCTKCHDIITLIKKPRTCTCGASSGKYIDSVCVEIFGPCRVIVIFDKDYIESLSVNTNTNYKWTHIISSEENYVYIKSEKSIEPPKIEQKEIKSSNLHPYND